MSLSGSAILLLLTIVTVVTAANELELWQQQCALARKHVVNEIRATHVSQRFTNVSVGITFERIGNIKPAKNTLEATVSFRMKWTDSRLDYNHTGCVDKLFVENVNGIWRPVFAITNTIKPINYDNIKETGVVVSPSGEVTWILPITVSLFCPFSVLMYPFDHHYCFIAIHSMDMFGISFIKSFSYAYNCMADASDVIGVDYIPDPWSPINFTSHALSMPLWEVGHSCHINFLEDLVGNIYFYFILKRKSQFYIPYLIVPAIAVSTVQVSMFVDDLLGEKAIVPITVMLAYFFLISSVNDAVPASSEELPYVTLLFTFLLFTGAIATFVAILIANYGDGDLKTEGERKRVQIKLRRLNLSALAVYAVVTFAAYVLYFVAVMKGIGENTTFAYC